MTDPHATPDLDAFLEFVANRLGDGARRMPLEDAVASFHRYRDQLARLREHLRPSIEQADRGEVRPLDLEALFARLHDQTSPTPVGGEAAKS
ncbi:MAG: hypothetical protein ACRCT8_13350 [Lacipirellulaceae bacterium]